MLCKDILPLESALHFLCLWGWEEDGSRDRKWKSTNSPETLLWPWLLFSSFSKHFAPAVHKEKTLKTAMIGLCVYTLLRERSRGSWEWETRSGKAGCKTWTKSVSWGWAADYAESFLFLAQINELWMIYNCLGSMQTSESGLLCQPARSPSGGYQGQMLGGTVLSGKAECRFGKQNVGLV